MCRGHLRSNACSPSVTGCQELPLPTRSFSCATPRISGQGDGEEPESIKKRLSKDVQDFTAMLSLVPWAKSYRQVAFYFPQANGRDKDRGGQIRDIVAFLDFSDLFVHTAG